MLKKRWKRQGPLAYLIVMNGRISFKALRYASSGFMNFRYCGTSQHLSISFLVEGGRVTFPLNLIWF